MSTNIIDGSNLELRNVKAWRRKLGLVDSGETRIVIDETTGRSTVVQIISTDQLPARLRAFNDLNEAGYIVQTRTDPPTFAGRMIRGVTNGISVVNGTGINGDTVLHLPQALHISANPLFWGLQLSSLDPEHLVVTDETSNLVSSIITTDEINVITGITGLTGVLQGTAGSPVTAALGTANFLTKWSGTDPYLVDSVAYDDGTSIGVGTTTPLNKLHTLVEDATTNAVTTIARLTHNSTGTPAANFGTGLTFGGASDTTDDQDIASLQAHWADPTHAVRTGRLRITLPKEGAMLTAATFGGYGTLAIGQAVADIDRAFISVGGSLSSTSTVFGILFESIQTGSGDSIAMQGVARSTFVGTVANTMGLQVRPGRPANAATIVTLATGVNILGPQISAGSVTTSVGLAIAAQDITGVGTGYGIQQKGAADLNYFVGPSAFGTTSPVSTLQLLVNTSDAITVAVTEVLRLNHNSSGTPGASFGTGLGFYGKSSTTDQQLMVNVNAAWTVATHASRTSALFFQTVSGAATATTMVLSGAGGLSVGDAVATTANGVINASIGYRVASAAATSGTVLGGNGTNFVPTAISSLISGTDGYFPYWQAGVPLASTSQLYQSGSFVGAGETTPLTRLHVSQNDAVTNAITSVLTVGHTGNAFPQAVAGFGAGIDFVLDSTIARRVAAQVAGVWSDSTDATRTGTLQFGTVNSAAALVMHAALSGAGGFSVGATAMPATAGRLYLLDSGARTTTVRTADIVNTMTSATLGAVKYGLFLDLSGAWTGTDGQVWGISMNVAGAASASNTTGGVEVFVSGTVAATYGYYAANTSTGANSTNVGIQGSATGAATGSGNNRGGYFTASNASGANYAVFATAPTTTGFAYYGSAGKWKNDSADSIICSGAALGTTATAGFIYVPSCAGTPTGVPTTETGTVPIIIDTTNDVAYFYRASWKAFSRAANPTASVGIAAVNGTAATFMRSDAAPAIDLAMAPGAGGLNPWTGVHRWNPGTTSANTIIFDMATPAGAGQRDSHWLEWRGTWHTGASANTTYWRCFVDITSNSGASVFRFDSVAGGGAFVDRFRITDAGGIVLADAGVATTATDGFLWLPSCAGTPTGVPVTYTNRVAFVYDRTNDLLYAYNGAWRSAAFT